MVLAPPSVTLQSSWKDHIVAKFHGRIPDQRKIFADLNPVWGKFGNITIRSHSENTCLIYVPCVSTREWILQVGYWQVSNCALTVFPWTSEALWEEFELTSAPTWAVLKSVPLQLYSLHGISVIASAIGEPLHTEKSRLEPYHSGDTKVKIEIILDASPPKAVIVRDSQGFSVTVNVDYPRLPPKCCNCEKFGHLLNCCPLPLSKLLLSKGADKEALASQEKETQMRPGSTIAQVDIKDTSLEEALEPQSEVRMETQIPVPAITASEAVVEEDSIQNEVKQIAPKKKKKSIGHRKDHKKRMMIRDEKVDKPQDQDSKVVEAVAAAESQETPVNILNSDEPEIEPDPDVEEEFQPSPAALKKLRIEKRREAYLACYKPTTAVSHLFTSLRDSSRGRSVNRS